MVPPSPSLSPLCLLPAGPGPPRYVCYCEGEETGSSSFSLYVTDAVELWGTCFPPDQLPALRARFGLGETEDISVRFRAACEQQSVTFALQEDIISLTFSVGSSTLTFDLLKLPGPDAGPRLQALMLGLAKRVCWLEEQLPSPAAGEMSASPRKKPWQVRPQLFLPDQDPQRGGPGPGVRRRCPGESLVNPGFKSKKPASGVDFEDT
ncbi:PREDICTED: uncharacterized protein C9orf142 homolog [Elephantulus edwardii]|uniref:uncharacterized protein C9orf142 homolog n=1 Tax=Elephantulus edwardii TaxID=28737 RepID=UPI0003F0A709|nr:PREDICTED: uncharacterized protein C9orf142 homolog [Elephantulus edwardii]